MHLQLGSALWPLAEFDRISACLEEAERLALSLDDRPRLGRTAARMSVPRWVTGDSESARRLAERARDMAASIEGLTLLERAIEIYDATRAWPFRALFTAHRGTACLLAGRHDDALALAREHHERGHEAWALHLLGRIALQSEPQDLARAEGHYCDASALAPKSSPLVDPKR